MSEKQGIRIDVFLKETHHLSREYAKELVKSGKVFVNGTKIEKPSFLLADTDIVTMEENCMPRYVSRGGLKLEKALQQFSISVQDKVCLDIGASTGGFTDCMLQHGAGQVFAIDVGTNQLVQALRENEKVVSMENTNIVQLPTGAIPPCEFCAVDVSFVSLTKILASVKPFLQDDTVIVALVKPQFEAGKQNIGKKGVVKERGVHRKVLQEVVSYCNQLGLGVIDLCPSPIKGTTGNIEYKIHMVINQQGKQNIAEQMQTAIEHAFAL